MARRRGVRPTTTCSRRWASGRRRCWGPSLAGVPVDVVVHGAMRRQRETAEQLVEAAGWAATPSVDERWDEMDHQGVLDALPPEFDGEPDARQFQAWSRRPPPARLSGDHDRDYSEPWTAFRDRVLAGFEAFGDGTTVVVTSAGPVSFVVAQLLESPAATGGSRPWSSTPPSPRSSSAAAAGTLGVVQPARSSAGRSADVPLTRPSAGEPAASESRGPLADGYSTSSPGWGASGGTDPGLLAQHGHRAVGSAQCDEVARAAGTSGVRRVEPLRRRLPTLAATGGLPEEHGWISFFVPPQPGKQRPPSPRRS